MFEKFGLVEKTIPLHLLTLRIHALISDFPEEHIRNLIFCDNGNQEGKVKIAKNGQVEKLFKLPIGSYTGAVCCTRSGDILLHIIDDYDDGKSFHKIFRYRGPEITQEIEIDEQGKPTFENNSSVLYMSENNNGDICVSDTKAKSVVVLNRREKARFRYDGSPARSKQTFSPGCVVIDCLGQIVVTDSNNA